MYAVVDIAGDQIRVEKGMKIRVPRLDIEEGSTVECDRILFYSDDKDVKVGTPHVEGINVKAEVLEHARDRKVVVFKMKRRKRYRKKTGHRQGYTVLEIKDISK
ncbi:MAG: 50S ribosomal protein L21 [Candidatus Latescibacteria bacterium]|nr:50S ribosomal protein L21 [bacterium]MBD3424984.1 50S ribosomal protein L21 [Candidatus Latescibacterota bacterium]